MSTEAIPEGTVWRFAGFKIALSRTGKGKFTDESGKEREGPFAVLVIVPAGHAGKGERRLKVGKGDVVRVGERSFEVVDVFYNERGEGAIKVRPR